MKCRLGKWGRDTLQRLKHVVPQNPITSSGKEHLDTSKYVTKKKLQHIDFRRYLHVHQKDACNTVFLLKRHACAEPNNLNSEEGTSQRAIQCANNVVPYPIMR